jgi:hypothetical protein
LLAEWKILLQDNQYLENADEQPSTTETDSQAFSQDVSNKVITTAVTCITHVLMK